MAIGHGQSLALWVGVYVSTGSIVPPRIIIVIVNTHEVIVYRGLKQIDVCPNRYRCPCVCVSVCGLTKRCSPTSWRDVLCAVLDDAVNIVSRHGR